MRLALDQAVDNMDITPAQSAAAYREFLQAVGNIRIWNLDDDQAQAMILAHIPEGRGNRAHIPEGRGNDDEPGEVDIWEVFARILEEIQEDNMQAMDTDGENDEASTHHWLCGCCRWITRCLGS